MWPIGNRKFMYASTSHIVFRVDMCTLRDISSMLSSYSPSNNIGDSNYSPDNEALKLVHSDDDLRLRPSLLSRTCDRTILMLKCQLKLLSMTLVHSHSLGHIAILEMSIGYN